MVKITKKLIRKVSRKKLKQKVPQEKNWNRRFTKKLKLQARWEKEIIRWKSSPRPRPDDLWSTPYLLPQRGISTWYSFMITLLSWRLDIIALLADLCWLRHTFSSGPGEQTKPGSQGWVKQPSPGTLHPCASSETLKNSLVAILVRLDLTTLCFSSRRSFHCATEATGILLNELEVISQQSALFHPHMHAESPRFESGCCQAVDLFH